MCPVSHLPARYPRTFVLSPEHYTPDYASHVWGCDVSSLPFICPLALFLFLFLSKMFILYPAPDLIYTTRYKAVTGFALAPRFGVV